MTENNRQHMLGRLFGTVPVLFGVLVFTFILMRVLPGDPAVFFASGPNAGPAEIEELRRQMGLDKPLFIQLFYYLGDILQGDLGNSYTTGQPVLNDLIDKLPASLELTLFALTVAVLLSVPMGVAAALRPGTLIDHAVRFVCTVGVCVPTFVSGLLLILVFYYILGWAPDPTGRLDAFLSYPPRITGFLTVDALLNRDLEVWFAAIRQLLLPAATMALFVLAPLTRMTRASMLAVLSSDMVRTAEAVGLHRARIIFIYALRNALLPVLTMSGVVFSSMMGANVLVEKVYSWPGVASYALNSILASDYAPVQGFVLTMALLCVMVNIVVDLLYRIVDPRVSFQ